MRNSILLVALALAASGCVTTRSTTVRGMLVGTPVCPQLNAHKRRACKFSRNGHGFQVWPERIQIKPTSVDGIYRVTKGRNSDLMFDHVLRFRKDDHVAFECFIRPSDGAYFGPFGFRIKRGGVWATYGLAINAVTAAVVGAAGAAVAGPGGAIAGGVAGSFVGGLASRYLGAGLSKLGSRAWEREAGQLAERICRYLAAHMKAE